MVPMAKIWGSGSQPTSVRYVEHPPFKTKFTLPFNFHRSTASAVANRPANQLSLPPVQERVSCKRKRSESCADEIDQALLLRLQTLQQQQDGETAFDEHVAATLQQMNPHQQAIARIGIDKVLLRSQFPEHPYLELKDTF